MEFGICYGELDLSACAAAGFDYCELAAARVLDPGVSDREWAATRDRILSAALPVPVCNLFFPGDLKLVGPERDLARAVEYADKVFQRLEAIGGRVQVFGSGGARRAPEGYAVEKATEDVKELLARIAPLAERRSVVIAMEHLRSAECNVLTTFEATLALVREVDHPAVRALVDLYHLGQMNEPLGLVGSAGGLLAHVHIADPATRHDPASAGSDLRPLFRQLKAADYDACISLECRWDDLADGMKAARDVLAAQWAEA